MSAPRKRGRPPFKPTAKHRKIVEEMKFFGESDNVIARSLGIDDATLRKHFPEELANGHAHRRREVIGMLFKSARAGNVSAQKKLEETSRAAGAAEAIGKRGAAPAQPRAPKEERPGKKEERQAAAARVGGKYAVPVSPKLVVDNSQ